jgi:hypothetical protein
MDRIVSELSYRGVDSVDNEIMKVFDLITEITS